MCSPSLSWLYPWSQIMSRTVCQQLSHVQCRVENSHQMPPLIEVMEYYTTKVNPFCPPMCACYVHHFASTPDNAPSFTVLVNCSSQGLTTFPTLPPRTTVLDLSCPLYPESEDEGWGHRGGNLWWRILPTAYHWTKGKAVLAQTHMNHYLLSLVILKHLYCAHLHMRDGRGSCSCSSSVWSWQWPMWWSSPICSMITGSTRIREYCPGLYTGCLICD